MKENSSSHQGYSIIEESDDNSEFSFTTDYGIRYIVYFAEADGYVPSASFAHDTKMFGFGPTSETRPKGKLPSDPQVGVALFEILYFYISKYPDRILVYVCSDESIWYPGPDHKHPRFAKWRFNVFSIWYTNWQQVGVMPAEKIDYCLYGEIYCSCVFRSGNPYEVEVRQTIEDVIFLKQP